MQIVNKAQFMELSTAGLLGNTLRTWHSKQAALASGCQCFTVRGMASQSTKFKDWLTRGELVRYKLPGGAYLQEVPPKTAQRVCNIEAGYANSSSDLWLYLELAATGLPVRGIRDRVAPSYGLRARLQLMQAVGRLAYEQLYDLWERHPTATIEATYFDRACGVDAQNLVIWEVRDF